jgi:glycosyltransferase involved in cell wall biosynthesis
MEGSGNRISRVGHNVANDEHGSNKGCVIQGALLTADKPNVSVLLPVRGAENFLDVCIASLERQTLRDFEVVAVDDGSTDRSAEILDAWARRDSRVRVIHQPATGLVASLNTGLELCTAPFVARMDADDVSHPLRFELQARALEKEPDLGVISCRVRHFPWHSVGQGFRIYEGWLNSLVTPEEIERERFVESPVAHPSAMLRREVAERSGGYRDLGWPEDYEFWLRLLEAGVRVGKLDPYLYFWREHGERLTRRDSRYSVENFLRCKAHYLLRGPLAKCHRVVLWGAGQTGRRLSKHLLRGGAPVAAFVDIDPDKVGRTLRGKPIVDSEDLPALLGDGTVVLAAVASRGARALIREQLDALGLAEGRDYWCVA